MRPTATTATIAVLLLLAGAPPAQAFQPCVPPLLVPTVGTAPGAVLPPDGAVIVADQIQVGVADALAPLQHWRLVVGERRVRPRIMSIAPGLRLVTPAGTGLVGPRDTGILSFSLDTKPRPPLAAPAPTGVVEVSTEGSWPFTSVRVEFADRVPEGRYLVVFGLDGTPRSWGRTTGTNDVFVYVVGRCQTTPYGTIPSRANDRVSLMWVDVDGRTSPRSAPATITVATRPAKMQLVERPRGE